MQDVAYEGVLQTDAPI